LIVLFCVAFFVAAILTAVGAAGRLSDHCPCLVAAGHRGECAPGGFPRLRRVGSKVTAGFALSATCRITCEAMKPAAGTLGESVALSDAEAWAARISPSSKLA
jgi:hypothetical protein